MNRALRVAEEIFESGEFNADIGYILTAMSGMAFTVAALGADYAPGFGP